MITVPVVCLACGGCNPWYFKDVSTADSMIEHLEEETCPACRDKGYLSEDVTVYDSDMPDDPDDEEEPFDD